MGARHQRKARRVGLVVAQIGIGLAALVRGILYDWRV